MSIKYSACSPHLPRSISLTAISLLPSSPLPTFPLFHDPLVVPRAVPGSAHLEIFMGRWLVHCWHNNWRQWLNFPQNPPVPTVHEGWLGLQELFVGLACDWLLTGPVLYRKLQLLWAQVCSGCVTPWRSPGPALLPISWLLHSFSSLFYNVLWISE